MSFYVRSSVIYKTVNYGILFFLISMLETVTIPLAGAKTVPDLVLCAVVAVGMAEDERTAGVCGVAAGFFIDALGAVGLCISPLLYGACGYLTGVLVRFLLRRNLPSYLIYVLCAAAARSVITLMMVYVFGDTVPLYYAFADILIPEFILTVLCSPVLYLIIVLPLARKNRQSLKN
ncbi:MAG: rod shape-determining protein MreD [Clostridia bacterium]|nr:rod shape-determining protein MreD [Clostridia bacterium]